MRYRCSAIYPSLFSVLAVLSSATCTPEPSSSAVLSWDQPAEIPLPADNSVITDFNKWKQQLQPYTPAKKLHPHRRASTKCNGCEVLVHIGPIGQDTDVGQNRSPRKPRVVARILNKDLNDTEAIYQLQPETKAEYFVWLTPAPAGAKSKTEWILVEITKKGNQGYVKHLFTGLEVYCGPAGDDGSDADFYACYKIHPTGDTTVRASSRTIRTSSPISQSELISWSWVSRFVSLIRQTTDTTQRPEGDPAWLRCTQGCCTAALM